VTPENIECMICMEDNIVRKLYLLSGSQKRCLYSNNNNNSNNNNTISNSRNGLCVKNNSLF
jgi:hypothetical protein